jgi:potassium-transporting ATPase potassium-binding subunit
LSDDTLQLVFFAALILGLAPPMGIYMFMVYTGAPTPLSPVLGPVERLIYRLAGINPKAGQHWTRYALAVLALSLAGFLLLYAVLRLQHILPLNPRDLGPVSPALAFNTAVSFITNSNWQAYAGETTLSYLSQMAGCTVQNFLSAATGMAIAAAVIRGFAGKQIKTLGNFYVDVTRSILYILLPISIIACLIFVWQGVPQTLGDYVTAKTVEGPDQIIAQGPVASQLSIKSLGSNGGGFFGANSAHPYENPNPITAYIQLILFMLIPAAFPLTFGKMAGDIRQGWALFSAMAIIYCIGVVGVYMAEGAGNPFLDTHPIDQAAGNMEGKEVRFGLATSALWAVTVTATGAGATNASLDSFTPIGGLIPKMNIQMGEIVFGGVGAGIYAMLLYVLLVVFIAGLMVGRTPEYLGKKIETKEIKLTVLTLLLVPIGMLLMPAIALMVPSAAAAIQEKGPHGLSELLYAYASATAANGSSFAGFDSSVRFHLVAQAMCMLAGRFLIIIPILAIAGSLAVKKPVIASVGTLPTHTPLFVALIIIVIIVFFGALTFFPALALAPIAEHVEMLNGRLY